MQLLDSIIDGALLMPNQKDAEAFIFAFVKYMRTGEEPTSLKGGALSSWVMCFPAIENSRARSLAGSKPSGTGRRRKNQTDNQTTNQNGNQNKNQTDNQTTNQNAIKRGNEQVSSSSSYSYSCSSSLGEEKGCDSTGVGVQGEGFAPPTLDEARAYFAANLLKGDPDLFWANYDQQGWVSGNGLPITSWTSAALKWSRKQVAIDAEKPPAEQQPKPVPNPVNGVDPADDLERLEREFAEKYGEVA